MLFLLVCVLVPALLLCAFKLSLVERAVEILPSALVVAMAPIVMHPVAVQLSLRRVEQMLGTKEALETLSVLLAMEGILSLLLIATIMVVHANIKSEPTSGRHPKWTVRLTTPLWTVLSPAGIAVILGAHMYLLHTTTGMGLWSSTLMYAGALFSGLTLLAFALRLTVRGWQTRLSGVLLLAFFLLAGAMFLPLLASTVPPPSSVISVNWPATLVFAVLVLGGATAAYLQHRRLRPHHTVPRD